MNPKTEYSHYKALMGLTRKLLPTLERIVPIAEKVALEQGLDADQQTQLAADFEIVMECKETFTALQNGLMKAVTPEALFVSSAIRGGLNNLLQQYYIFADTWTSDPEFARDLAGDIKRQPLHPYARLFHDAQTIKKDLVIPTGVNFMMGGKDVQDAVDDYKTAPYPADIVGVSEAVYGLVFSALLLSAGKEGAGQLAISLDFTARKDCHRGFLEIENRDRFFADYLERMVGKHEMQPTFLEQAFAAGLSVHGTTIRVPFQIARMV